MTEKSEQFPYLMVDNQAGAASLAPYLPVILQGTSSVSTLGLVDSGAALNVLPYQVGEQLGLVWDEVAISVDLGGVLPGVEARGVAVQGIVGKLPPVPLVFAWANSNSVPLILGQVNFFTEFDVCFFRSRSVFEVRRRQVVP